MRKTTGISLMLLIFLTLCLVTFSLLSLSGAKADEKLSQEAANRTLEYYQAETRAYQVVSDIDNLLADCLKESVKSDTPEETWLSACSEIPDKAESTAALSWNPENRTLSFDITITENQVLHVELLPDWPESEEDSLYDITIWQAVNTQDWSADNSLDVYQR